MKWQCGWSENQGRCLRFDCREDGPCEGFVDPRTCGHGNREQYSIGEDLCMDCGTVIFNSYLPWEP